MRKMFELISLMTGLLLSPVALAIIDVLPKEIVVDTPTASVRIINNSDHVEYVSIALKQLVNPGVALAQETLVPVELLSTPTLYAYPFKLTLGPGQSKKITLRSVRSPTQETVYRLEIKPITSLLPGSLIAPLGNIVVNVSFSALVRQLPDIKTPKLSVACVPTGATFIASGNVRYTVKGAMVDGQMLDVFNVYPGVPITIASNNIVMPKHPPCKK